VVKSALVSFPPEGVTLHISAADAIAYGINPGDPAVMEVIVREHTVDEWIAEVSAGTFESEAEQGDVSEPESDTRATTAGPSAGGAVEDHPRISWRPATKPIATTSREEPERISWRSATKPIVSTSGEEPERISWRSARLTR
jgi:hypothetical protein